MQQTRFRAESAAYIYEVPMRIWHWVNALCIVTLSLSGYFIGSPLPSMPGQASDHFLMGYIRFTHFAAGEILIVAFILRVYWAFAGNRYAREIFLPKIASKKFWLEVFDELFWYAFVAKEPKKYLGHNPAATICMHIFFLWGVIFMIFSGLALYGEGEGMGSWQYRFFSSWFIPLIGNSQDVHTYHHLGMWFILMFVFVHIYTAIREDIVSRQSIISTMISGWRTFKDDRPLDEPHL